ncbi:MAG: pentapeptide repeat-containing protein, partial [Pirellulales bacterium]|nr:pentapeptide repeat-containing protein [Pirellulales bacterium]
FRHCSFRHCSFRHCSFRHCSFRHCSFRHCSFRHCSFRHCSFRHCSLTGHRLRKVWPLQQRRPEQPLLIRGGGDPDRPLAGVGCRLHSRVRLQPDLRLPWSTLPAQKPRPGMRASSAAVASAFSSQLPQARLSATRTERDRQRFAVALCPHASLR